MSAVGLHDIGKWDDIDIDVQYCDIDITHDIPTAQFLSLKVGGTILEFKVRR